jgi:hypothetical protein
VHRKNSVLSSERNQVTENSVELCQAGIERVKVCKERTLVKFKEKSIRGIYSQSF